MRTSILALIVTVSACGGATASDDRASLGDASAVDDSSAQEAGDQDSSSDSSPTDAFASDVGADDIAEASCVHCAEVSANPPLRAMACPASAATFDSMWTCICANCPVCGDHCVPGDQLMSYPCITCIGDHVTGSGICAPVTKACRDDR